MPTATCSPSESRRARLRAERSTPGSAPPAACNASLTRDPAGSRTSPGRATCPATCTVTADPVSASAVGAGASLELGSSVATGAPPSPAAVGDEVVVRVGTSTSSGRLASTTTSATPTPRQASSTSTTACPRSSPNSRPAPTRASTARIRTGSHSTRTPLARRWRCLPRDGPGVARPPACSSVGTQPADGGGSTAASRWRARCCRALRSRRRLQRGMPSTLGSPAAASHGREQGCGRRAATAGACGQARDLTPTCLRTEDTD